MRARAILLLGVVALALFASQAAPAQLKAQSAMQPPPSFRPSPDWWTVTTGPTDPSRQTPEVWAIRTVGSNVGALVPFDLFNGLKHLSPRGIVVWATTIQRGHQPGLPGGRLPMRLPSFHVDHGWEMQPAPNVEQRLRWVFVGGWSLDVRVYFATQHPSRTLLAQAQTELNRLLLPH